MAPAEDERPSRAGAAKAGAGAPPDLDQLLALIEPAAGPVGPASAAPAPATAPSADPRDDALTDLYGAVKVRPKALPLAELDPSSPHRSEEELAALEQARRAARRARLAAIVELGALAALMLTALWLVRSWRVPELSDPGSGSMASTRALTRTSPSRRRPAGGGRALLSPRAGVGAVGAESRGDDDLEPGAGPVAGGGAAAASVRIKIEQRGDAIVVPVQLSGPRGALAAKLVFDTGATFTTLDAATLQRLGVAPSPVASDTDTAGGRVRRSLAVIEGAAVGAARVAGGLTVGVCEGCGGAGAVGLLGLNFTRHFVVTLDAQQGELLLQPRAERTLVALSEIEPFVAFVETRTAREDGKLVISFSVENHSPRALRDLVVAAELQGAQGAGFAGPPQVRIAAVPVGGRVAARIEAPLAGSADQVATIELRRAAW